MVTEDPPAGREDKISKYLLYAIGEITPVVIGVLITLNLSPPETLGLKGRFLDENCSIKSVRLFKTTINTKR